MLGRHCNCRDIRPTPFKEYFKEISTPLSGPEEALELFSGKPLQCGTCVSDPQSRKEIQQVVDEHNGRVTQESSPAP